MIFNLRVLAAIALLLTSPIAAFAAQRCTAAGEQKRCESSFGPGTAVIFSNSGGDIGRMVIDVPDTSTEPSKFLIFVGLTMAKLSPKLTPDDRADALKKLLALGAKQSKEQLRLGNWDWGAVWIDKHLTLSLQKSRLP